MIDLKEKRWSNFKYNKIMDKNNKEWKKKRRIKWNVKFV